MKLSTRRAESVKKYLVDQGHIPQNDIVAIGKGERDPIYPNTPATRYKNRRVDLEFLTYVTKEEQVKVMLPASQQATPERVTAAPFSYTISDGRGGTSSATVTVVDP